MSRPPCGECKGASPSANSLMSKNSHKGASIDTVKVESLDNLQHVVTTAHHAFVVDDSHNVGGALGPNPYELLLASLGT